jgi:hypothetical protein
MHKCANHVKIFTLETNYSTRIWFLVSNIGGIDCNWTKTAQVSSSGVQGTAFIVFLQEMNPQSNYKVAIILLVTRSPSIVSSSSRSWSSDVFWCFVAICSMVVSSQSLSLTLKTIADAWKISRSGAFPMWCHIHYLPYSASPNLFKTTASKAVLSGLGFSFFASYWPKNPVLLVKDLSLHWSPQLLKMTDFFKLLWGCTFPICVI